MVSTGDDVGGPLVASVGTQPAVLDFTAFYAASHATVAGALTLTIGDASLAAEATDEAMTRAYQRWATVSAYRNPTGWVYRVGLNWARSWFRRRREVASVWIDQPAATTAMADPALDRALAELDVKHRSVVVLRYLLDWSVAATADALDIAPGTVKSRLSRALDLLEVRLRHLDDTRDDHDHEGTTP